MAKPVSIPDIGKILPEERSSAIFLFFNNIDSMRRCDLRLLLSEYQVVEEKARRDRKHSQEKWDNRKTQVNADFNGKKKSGSADCKALSY
jgi:hypothetical protein